MVDQGSWPRRREWYLRWGKASNSERLGIVWRQHRGLVVSVGLVAVGVGAWRFWDQVSAFGGWLHRYSDTINRLTLAAGVGAAVFGGWIAFRRSQTERLRQVTDSFEGAVTLLGHEDRSVRLGAIYALERIARQNQNEHWPIMETLTAYVREHSTRRKALAELHGDEPKEDYAPAHADVQGVFAVLGRRMIDHEKKMGDPPRRLNLVGTHLVEVKPDLGREYSGVVLSRANLMGADLERANLTSAHLEEANLTVAHLQRADLTGAHLQRANLTGAYLEQANLAGADLADAKLTRAHLEGANLKGAVLLSADLVNARLEGASLENAVLLRADLQDAHLVNTKLEKADLKVAHFKAANLTGARLYGAALHQANLAGACLDGANLENAVFYHTNLGGVDLSTASGITQEQLNWAIGDKDTKIPKGLTRPEHWSS